jgi:DNA repair photolyase
VTNHIKKDLRKIHENSLISIANSLDPYQPMELKHQIMKRLLPILKKHRVLIITKSDIVKRDSLLVKEIGTPVSITITTDDDEPAKILEPGSPPPEKRIKALKRLANKGIRVSVRVDPIIPFLNEDVCHLIEWLSDVGVNHVISSTYKLRYDPWNG